MTTPSIPPIESYSSEQINSAVQFSSVLQTYIQRAQLTTLYGFRHRAWCETFLATFHQSKKTADVCRYWSQVADQVICEVANEVFDENEFVVFAFGKLGSQELNLSSDVDLLIVSENGTENGPQLARRFQARLSELTQEGFLFRVDYELRPGGKSAPLVPTLDQVIDYYGNYGETWERMAFIRLRPIWGSQNLIQKIMAFRRAFSFRKHLDYGLLEDLNDLRNKVQAHARALSRPNQINLKLSEGGIRDIELYCHALQVIHGGRNFELHTSSTDEAFLLFAKHSLLPQKDATFLGAVYWRLRHFENLIQGRDDQQIHFFPESSLETFGGENLAAEMKIAGQIVGGLLGAISVSQNRFPDGLEEQKQWLLVNGFSESEAAGWEMPTPLPSLARQKEKDLSHRSIFLAEVLKKMGARSPLENRLSYLREFLTATRAKTSFYSLLVRNENLLSLLAETFCSSPFLSRALCSRPEILDSVVMRNVESLKLESAWDDFLQGLVDLKQLTEFLAGIDFLRSLDLEKLQGSLSELADDVVGKLLNKIELEYPPLAIKIWRMGKWGGREIGVQSDLDCIFVSSKAPVEKDIKAVRRFISRLTESHRGGSLYSLDTRLRTSENTGVLITSEEDLFNHIQRGLHPWERQAYLKAQILGTPSIEEKTWRSLLVKIPFSSSELAELERIRVSLLKNRKNVWDLKYQEGGLVDVELAVQTALIQFGLLPARSDFVSLLGTLAEQISAWKNVAATLQKNYRFMRVVEQCLRLVSDESQPVLTPENAAFGLVASHLQLSSEQLQIQLRSALQEQVDILKSLDPRRQQK